MRGFEYSSSVFKVFDDENLEPYNQTWHPRIKDIVYWGMVRFFFFGFRNYEFVFFFLFLLRLSPDSSGALMA